MLDPHNNPTNSCEYNDYFNVDTPCHIAVLPLTGPAGNIADMTGLTHTEAVRNKIQCDYDINSQQQCAKTIPTNAPTKTSFNVYFAPKMHNILSTLFTTWLYLVLCYFQLDTDFSKIKVNMSIFVLEKCISLWQEDCL